MTNEQIQQWVMKQVRDSVGEGKGPFDNDWVHAFKTGEVDTYLRVGRQLEVLSAEDERTIRRVLDNMGKAKTLN